MSDALAFLGGSDLDAAALHAIQHAEQRLGVQFPGDYIDFLLRSNGFVGYTPRGADISLDPVQQLAALNEAGGRNQYFPDIVIIGSNGGGTAYGFTRRRGAVEYVRFDFVDPNDTIEYVGHSLLDMLRSAE
jgi:hypothetical protein